MNWSSLIFVLIFCTKGLSKKESPDLVLIGLNYEDACFTLGQFQWNFIKNPNNDTLNSWINALNEYRSVKLDEKDKGNIIRNETQMNESTEYKYELIYKPGDMLLDTKDWMDLTSFVGKLELLKLEKTHSQNNYLTKNDAENLLAQSETPEDKLKNWESWHKNFQPYSNEYLSNIKLIQKAAEKNEMNNLKEYWESLSELKHGYSKAQDFWNEISSLHNRLLKFIRNRLNKKYGNVITSDDIPAHLLGSLEGYDWTSLAMDVISPANSIFEIRKNLLKNNLVGMNLYRSASHLGGVTLKQVPEAQFFKDSDFDGQCPSKLINFCRDARMKLSTCSQSSISNYLAAHKNIARVLFHQISEQSHPILNNANRYSALEEGVTELFGILSASQAWLSSLHLINETDDLDQAKVISVMITALDVLPRLAYYFNVDLWRISVVNNETTDSKILTDSWWEYRSHYEGITSNSMEMPTFLNDNFIVSNKPYLSKFMGIILAFQIYEYLMDSTEIRIDSFDKLPINRNFIKMIQSKSDENWYTTVTRSLNFYDISVEALIGYFMPLEQYLSEVENEEIEIPKELENSLKNLENEYKNNPTTVATTVDASMKNISIKQPSTVLPVLHKNDTTNLKNKTSEINKASVKDSESSEDIDTPNELDENSNNEDTSGGQLIKPGSKKAVYAVGAVLIATITIVLISIFGRRRCRKTPKNRRDNDNNISLREMTQRTNY